MVSTSKLWDPKFVMHASWIKWNKKAIAVGSISTFYPTQLGISFVMIHGQIKIHDDKP